MPNTALDKIRRKAVELRKKHGGSYHTNLKRAGRMYREGKIGGRRKKTKAAKKRTTKSRSHSSGSHRLAGVRPENLRGTLADARRQLQAELGWNLAAQRTAKTKKEKKGLQPKINELTRKLKALKD